MATWTKQNAASYRADYRTHGIDMPYNALVEALGEPLKAADGGYPDDPDKTDVCWSFISENGDQIGIWNYKNGPNYCNEIKNIEEIEGFSVWASSQAAFDDFVIRFNLISD